MPKFSPRSAFRRLQEAYWRLKLASFGSGSRLCRDGSMIVTPKTVSIGSMVFIGPRLYISAEVKIDDMVMGGPGLSIIGGNHRFGVMGKHNRYLSADNTNTRAIEIHKDVWIGANVTILPNVIIGEGAVVGAGSIVTRSIRPFTLNAGNPCREIRELFTQNDLVEHRRLLNESPGP